MKYIATMRGPESPTVCDIDHFQIMRFKWKCISLGLEVKDKW